LRKINQHENEVLVGVILEFLGPEDFLVHADTPWAPVGAGEIEEDVLVVRLCLFDCLVIIGEPVTFLCASMHDAEKKHCEKPD